MKTSTYKVRPLFICLPFLSAFVFLFSVWDKYDTHGSLTEPVYQGFIVLFAIASFFAGIWILFTPYAIIKGDWLSIRQRDLSKKPKKYHLQKYKAVRYTTSGKVYLINHGNKKATVDIGLMHARSRKPFVKKLRCIIEPKREVITQ